MWIPQECAEHEWTGFRFDHPANSACFDALYDGPANPFAQPADPGIPGVPGTIKTPGSGTLIEWNNVRAPVTAGQDPTSRDGHFGYQFKASNSGCPPGSKNPPHGNKDAPRASWRRVENGAPKTCPLSGTSIKLVPDDSHRLNPTDPCSFTVIVENLEEADTLTITLAARAWPETEPLVTGLELLARLRPDDSLFMDGFADLVTATPEVLAGASTPFEFVVPDDATVVLARYSVTTADGKPQYDVYVAFESGALRSWGRAG